MESEDQPFIHELNTDPVVRGNVVGWDFPSSLGQQTRWFSDNNTRATTTHRWVVEDLEGTAIGVTGLWDIDWHNRNAMTALKIGGKRPQRGRGLGTDAVMAVMAFAFYDVGLERLYSTILETNAASLKLYTEHCGLTIEGTSRNHVWRHGEFVNLIQVGILRGDFDRLPDADQYRRLTVTGRGSGGER